MKENIPPIDELVAAYLLGDMTPDEKAAFEQRLADNPDLREELEFQRAARKQLQQVQLEQQFRNDLQSARSEIAAEGRRKRRWLQGFALLSVVAVALLFLLNKDTDPQSTPPVQTPVQDTVPIAAQPQGEEDDPLVGASAKKITHHFKAPLLRFSPITDSLKIKLVEDTRQKAILEPNLLAIHYLPGQMPDEKNIRLFELTIDGRRVLYLKMDGRFFRLKVGEQGLMEEKDETIFRWFE